MGFLNYQVLPTILPVSRFLRQALCPVPSLYLFAESSYLDFHVGWSQVFAWNPWASPSAWNCRWQLDTISELTGSVAQGPAQHYVYV